MPNDVTQTHILFIEGRHAEHHKPIWTLVPIKMLYIVVQIQITSYEKLLWGIMRRTKSFTEQLRLKIVKNMNLVFLLIKNMIENLLMFKELEKLLQEMK